MCSPNYNYYKYCLVPQCKSTSIKTPDKLFVYVPNNPQMRKKWLKLAKKEGSLSTNTRMYFCEDHFDLPNDMLNYTEYHIMGKVSQVRMKPGCLPHKFECQEGKRKRTCSSTEQENILKRQTIKVEVVIEPYESDTSDSPLTDTPHTRSDHQTVGQNEPEICEQKANKSVPVTHKFRSRAVRTNAKTKKQALSTLNPSATSSSTSPFKAALIKTSSASVSTLRKITRNLLIKEKHSDGHISLYIPSVATPGCSPSLQVESSSESSELIAEDRKQEANEMLLNTIKKIEKQPSLYIGVPKSCYYLIDILKDELNIDKHHVLLCLYKIKLDLEFNYMTDDFGITPPDLSSIFLKNIPLIASFMRPFIVELDSNNIKRTLPMAFRHKYSNVSCIIDCLEIEVQKPSKAVHQALTWSDYKKGNSIKYLISYTPDGLVNYISPGFGGRTTDTCVVQSCDFVKTLKSGMVVMADRGFKHIEKYLRNSNITLVRPPSVETGVKLSKCQANLTKQVASLRKHIDRVILRLREFYMLKPRACINFEFVKILDDIIIIACAIINLQNS